MSKAAARNVLEKLDSKPFGFFHLKMIVVSAYSIRHRYIRQQILNLMKMTSPSDYWDGVSH